MAVLSITLNDHFYKRSFKAGIYANEEKIGEVEQGATQEFEISPETKVIQAKKGFLASPKIEMNRDENSSCLFKVYRHPAVRLIRVTLVVSVLFFLAFMLFFNHELKFYLALLFLVPIVILFVLGVVFCKTNYFVIKEVEKI